MNIGIFAPGAAGDLLVSTGVLPHRHLLWPKDARIIWFVQGQFADLLKHNHMIDEQREWSGFNNLALRTADNRLDQARKRDYEKTSDLDEGYFSVPWLARAADWGIPYRDVPRKVFGASADLVWAPVLEWTDEEDAAAKAFIDGLPAGRRNIMIESHCHSHQSLWNQDTTALVMKRCREQLGECNFVMASKEAAGDFPNDRTVFCCAAMTIRQLVPIYNRCHMFFGCASGISVATCCWRASPKVVRCVYAGCRLFTCDGMSRGPNFESYNEPRNLEEKIREATCKAIEFRSSSRGLRLSRYGLWGRR